MKINNINTADAAFKAKLVLAGNTKSMPKEQYNYLCKIAGFIGDEKDLISAYVQLPRINKNYALINFAGYVNSKLKAFHSTYCDGNVFEGLKDGLIFSIKNMFIDETFSNIHKQKTADIEMLDKLISEYQKKYPAPEVL